MALIPVGDLDLSRPPFSMNQSDIIRVSYLLRSRANFSLGIRIPSPSNSGHSLELDFSTRPESSTRSTPATFHDLILLDSNLSGFLLPLSESHCDGGAASRQSIVPFSCSRYRGYRCRRPRVVEFTSNSVSTPPSSPLTSSVSLPTCSFLP